jgi:cytoskeletal protein CcmA (bactofilin family)
VADLNSGVLIVSEDMVIRGVNDMRNCRQLEIYGYVEGDVTARAVLIHKSGRCYGTLHSESAEVHGELQGDVTVKNLINIRSSGSVSGNVKYGKLALETGGNLSAEVRNVPPTLGGDLDLTVDKGRAVPITLQDLTALDPDDEARNLIFTVSNPRNGFVALAGAPARPVNRFTQSDLEGGQVLFRHDGTDTAAAGFSIVVADHTGATSGAAQAVKVAVRS